MSTNGRDGAALKPEGQGVTLSQPADGYRYSLDPFLLADFCHPRRREEILDLGAGVGVIGLLLASRHPTVCVTGVEMQPDLARCAKENARDSGLSGRCRIIRGDIREAPRFLPPEHFDRVVANPPYRKPGSGAAPAHPGRASARQELSFSLEDLSSTATSLLRFGGTLCAVHLAERLPEFMQMLSASGLTPKRLRFVSSFVDAAPRLCLLAAVKGGRPGLSVLPQLILYEAPGHYSSEAAAILRNGLRASRNTDKKTLP